MFVSGFQCCNMTQYNEFIHPKSYPRGNVTPRRARIREIERKEREREGWRERTMREYSVRNVNFYNPVHPILR